MDSGNSGSISTSGDEEYDSRPVHHHTLLPSTFLNQPIATPQFGSISNPQISSFISSSSHHHNPSLFDLSSTYLHSLSQSQHNTNPNSFPNLDTNISHGPRSEPDCTDVGVSSPSSSVQLNQCLLAPHQGLDSNARTVVSSPQTTNNAARNSKKRTRASRRAPTTVLTTDTSNFRAMVQEFTGIPAPPFSGSSYSRRLDLLTASSSLRSSSSHLDSTSAFYYPLRPSPQKLHHHQHQHQNQLFLSSSAPPSPSTLLHNNNNNMVDAIASSSATANNSSSNYQLLPPDLGLPYNHHPQNFMLSMQNPNQNQNQNHPILTFHPPQQQLHHLFGAGGFGAKSQQQTGLSVQSLEDLGVNQGQVNAHLLSQGHVSSEGMTLRCGGGGDDGGGRDGNGGSVGESRRDVCKLNFSGSASTTLNHDKTSLENRGEGGGGDGGGGVDSWICSSD